MLIHRPEDQTAYSPFSTKRPTPLPPQSVPLRLAAEEQHWLETGRRGDGTDPLKTSPAVAQHRAEVLSHWVETSNAVGSEHAAPPVAPQAAGLDDSFERLARGEGGEYVSESHAPDRLRLPAELTAGMAEAWRKSRPQGHAQEHGGLMLRNQDGATTWLPGGLGSSDSFEPDWRGVKPDQAVLATGHTHPYDEVDAGHTNVPFSGRDLSVHPLEDQRLSIVQSGLRLFASARTREFEEYVKTRGDAARGDIADEIKQYWETLYGCISGDTRQRAEAATRATSAHYHLLYYAGQRGLLKRVDTSAEPQHKECFANETSTQAATK